MKDKNKKKKAKAEAIEPTKKQIIEAQENAISGLEETIRRREGEIEGYKSSLEEEKEKVRKLRNANIDYEDAIENYKSELEEQADKIEELSDKARETRSSYLTAGLIIGIVVVVLAYLFAGSLLDGLNRLGKSDRYENFFASSDSDYQDGQHLFHLEDYLKANDVKIKYVFDGDDEDSSYISIWAKKGDYEINLHGDVYWHKLVYNYMPYSDYEKAPYERNIGEAR